MKSNLLVNMKKNEIIIKVSEEAAWENIIETLNKKLPVLKKLYKEAKNPIKVTGRFLKIKEMEEIQEIIGNEINVTVTFENVNELGLHGIKKAFEQNIESSETNFIRGGLRSGQKIEYEGSLVILGDVNSGAEVIAGENIVVLGNLRGLAHAGAKGNKKAIIASHRIESPQLRIANILKEMEKKDIEEVKQIAYIKEEEIILE